MIKFLLHKITCQNCMCLPAQTKSGTQRNLKDRGKNPVLIISMTQQAQLPCHSTVTNILQYCHAQIPWLRLTPQYFDSSASSSFRQPDLTFQSFLWTSFHFIQLIWSMLISTVNILYASPVWYNSNLPLTLPFTLNYLTLSKLFACFLYKIIKSQIKGPRT